MLKKFVTFFGGDTNKRTVDKLSPIVDAINALEPSFETLSDDALRAKTAEFRARLSGMGESATRPETLDDLLPEAFAAVREASKRTIGLRHYDVQLIGGVALHQSRIVEMRTGEGKTLVATLPLYLNALTGRGVHLITVNDYLARRDARWMAPIYYALGLTVGVLQMAARTENGKKAFLVDLDHPSPHEDQDLLRILPRSEAYSADITYGTNSEFGFDYLRDNMTMRLEDRVQRGHYYAIVDEADNVLIDEARTPLIISGPASDDTGWYARMAQLVRQLRPEDYEVSERDRTTTLTELGELHVEELLGFPLRDPDRPEDITPEQARLMGYLEQALRAQHLFHRNKDYLVQAGKVLIVDEFTGRLMPGRRWSDGLHQAVEAKEGLRVQPENVTYATVTIQNYFRMYEKLAGMTGTALTEAEEFDKIYKLDVIAIPTNLEYQAMRPASGLLLLDGRDEDGYKYRYYARRSDPSAQPVFWQRKDYPDVIYRTEEAKFRAITTEILRYHCLGRPLLVGTTSVELSDRLSGRLRAEPLRKLAQVMLLRHAWLQRNNQSEDGRLIAELQPLNAPLDQLQVPEMRKMARDLGISFNPSDPENLSRLLEILTLAEPDTTRLSACLQGGIPHQVLNARKHTEESQIIANAGAFGSVTIATNMAGRGVDIKLGGLLPENILDTVNRILRRAGYPDPYDMPLEERRQALQSLDPEQYGIYADQIQLFYQYMLDMARVKTLGGLHVIGSERHEARRIDNQLRGRAARQGDPGSSRFYLSLQDELMRRFGGDQANSLMQRFQVDDALPMEIGVVSRLVEQSQTRVEGANFDVRKHLLEYDDVLNSQRSRIYAQRDLIFTKPDLSEDVTEMLRTEVQNRVPQALKDVDGPWKLLAWLDQIQPPISVNGNIFPSYTLRLLLDQLESLTEATQNSLATPADVKEALLGLARESLDAEAEHLLHSVQLSLDSTRQHLQELIAERQDALDTFFEGLKLGEEEEAERSKQSGKRTPRELAEELSAAVHLNLRLTPEEQRSLRDDPEQIADGVRTQLESALANQASVRLMGTIERRLGEPVEVDPALGAAALIQALTGSDVDTLEEQVFTAIQAVLDRRRERLLGSFSPDTERPARSGDGNGNADELRPSDEQRPQGQIGRDLESALERINGPITSNHLAGLLLLMPQGRQTAFDKKTHRRIFQRTTRLSYTFYAARLLENRDSSGQTASSGRTSSVGRVASAEITDDVLKHLEAAQEVLHRALGLNEFNRLANASLPDMEQATQSALCAVLGEETCRQLQAQPLRSLPPEQIMLVISELGRMELTEIYRRLLLGVITELWVDYLTQMEALRVSIGLEAYAQRDPLVQYKSQASELFQTLLSNMRMGVIARMFTYRVTSSNAPQAGTRPSSQISPESEASSGESMLTDMPDEEMEADENPEGDEETPNAQILQPGGNTEESGETPSRSDELRPHTKPSGKRQRRRHRK
jgi:preprotein translocase subunit SecA